MFYCIISDRGGNLPLSKMKKEIKVGSEAREAIRAGVNKFAEPVTVTYGYGGDHVGMARGWADPLISRDGVTVAKIIRLPDEFENISAQIVRQASERTNEDAGDGTTGTVVLAQEIINKGLDLIESSLKPIGTLQLTREISKASEEVIEELEKMATPVTEEQRKQVAIISAQSEELGSLINEAIDKAGKRGSVVVEGSRSLTTEVDHQDGYSVEAGYIHEMFSTDFQRMIAVYKNKPIYVTNQDIEDRILLKRIISYSKVDPIIIANDFKGSALQAVIDARKEGMMFLPIKAPAFGQTQKNILEDICAMTGATFIDENFDLELLKESDIGIVKKVHASKSETIFEGKISKEYLKKLESKKFNGEYEEEKTQDRLAKLTNGVTVIKIGGDIDSERDDMKLRADDSIRAVKSAMDGGIVVGGGEAVLKARKAIDKSTVGGKMLYDSLDKLQAKIMENAGVTDLDLKGIVDPYKVVKNVVKNGVTSACMCLKMGALIVERTEKEDD